MVTKVYKINGMRSAMLLLDKNGMSATARFENYDSNACTCKYTTSTKFIQDAIEEHQWFKDGIVTIYATDGGEVVETPSDCPCDEATVRSMPRVKSVTSAANILVTQYGVYAEDVDTREKVIKVAEELGVSFPNLKE